MGMNLFGKSCYTNSSISTAPNPDPSRYEILRKVHFKNATLLLIQYKDCTNFEGCKVLVYEGIYNPQPGEPIDPHFQSEDISPIARFRPDLVKMAVDFARNL